MTESVQSVVAGSKSFVDAMGATLRIRLGAAPRVARDPAEAVRAGGGAELVVVECGGPEWLGAVRDLRTQHDRGACAIVAAVPAVRMTEAEALRAAGADEAVRWDGRVDPVVWAVDRVVAARARAAPATAADAIPVLAEAGAAPGPAPEAAFDLRELGVEPLGDADIEGPLLVPLEPEAAAAAPEPAPEGVVAPLAPAELASGEEVEALLAEHLRSGSVAPAFRATTEAIAGGLTQLERAALLGESLPVDPLPLRSAVALRWRATAILARAHSSGAVDAPAAQALPAEIDVALAALKAAGDAAPSDLAADLASSRNALVSVAVALTDSLAASCEVEEAPAAAPVQRARPTTRILSTRSGEERRWAWRKAAVFGTLLVVAAGVAVSYHLRTTNAVARARTLHQLPGAPAHTLGAVRGTGKVLSVLPGKTVDPADIERFRAAEEAQGNVVEQVGPGTWVVRPKPAGGVR
ncbi:MAG TPA: hypothetical protein VFP65_29955 [Anaeromyxobacteraceae bacterium]|nr:hypothetical protein [Anaeromyxobacteraceae bacterium]